MVCCAYPVVGRVRTYRNGNNILHNHKPYWEVNTMNHDYAHCLDYDENGCPKRCFRGALVRDLVNVPDYLPITWANFKGTQYCEMEKQDV